MNYRLLKYNPPFFNLTKQNNKAYYNRYKHRLIAWYLLHEYSIDHALIHLVKYTNIIKVLNNEFKEYKNEVEKLCQIDLNSKNKVYLKNTLLKCKICPNCGNRCLGNGNFCSVKCANQFKLKSEEHRKKISDGLKKYYSTNPDRTESNLKKSKTLKKYYNSLENKDYLKITGRPRSYSNITELNGFKIENYKGTESIVKVFCKKHGYIGDFKYSKVKYNSKYLCEQCYIENIQKKYYEKITKNCKFHKIKFLRFVDRHYIELKCKEHGLFKTLLKNFISHNTGCPLCNNTKAELELLDIVKKYDKDVKHNDRNIIRPLELDIYSEKYNFAIEYDGLMFHSFGKSKYKKFNNLNEDKNKHLIKTERCEDKDIQLFHIFENEWNNKKNIWKSIINSKLEKTNMLNAKKCTIKETSTKEAQEFCNINHLQEYSSSKIKIGLYYKEELVMIMTFNKSRFTKKYELIRMCSKLDTTIIGGASKLLKYFEVKYKPKSIIVHANRRYSDGSEYEKLGFKFSHNTEPNWFYFKPNTDMLEHRMKFQKYNDLLSESENMFNNGFRKIYDCGNKVYIKIYK